jgi:hypothetical protein
MWEGFTFGRTGVALVYLSVSIIGGLIDGVGRPYARPVHPWLTVAPK